MKMNRYGASVLTFLYLQSLSLYFVTGASLPAKNLVNTAGLIVENGNPRLRGEGGPNGDNFPRPTRANCVAGLTNRSDQVFGIYARISAWGHEHIGFDSYSAAVIQVSKDQGSEFKALRAGLHTFPALYNDTKVHMFVQWTVDRDWKTGCYNTDCPGFVPFNSTYDGLPLRPGMVIDELSSYNQTDKSIILQIVKDERKGIGGDWWLYHVFGPVRLPLGFWPASFFGSGVGTAQHAMEAAWYGAVGFGGRGIEPAMGNGHGPSLTGHAAYFADISLMGRDAYPVDPSLRGLLPMMNAERCYQVAMDAAGSNTFFYGGPVTPYCFA